MSAMHLNCHLLQDIYSLTHFHFFIRFYLIHFVLIFQYMYLVFGIYVTSVLMMSYSTCISEFEFFYLFYLTLFPDWIQYSVFDSFTNQKAYGTELNWNFAQKLATNEMTHSIFNYVLVSFFLKQCQIPERMPHKLNWSGKEMNFNWTKSWMKYFNIVYGAIQLISPLKKNFRNVVCGSHFIRNWRKKVLTTAGFLLCMFILSTQIIKSRHGTTCSLIISLHRHFSSFSTSLFLLCEYHLHCILIQLPSFFCFTCLLTLSTPVYNVQCSCWMAEDFKFKFISRCCTSLIKWDREEKMKKMKKFRGVRESSPSFIYVYCVVRGVRVHCACICLVRKRSRLHIRLAPFHLYNWTIRDALNEHIVNYIFFSIKQQT